MIVTRILRGSVSLFRRAASHPGNVAIVHDNGEKFSYSRLLDDSASIASTLLSKLGTSDLNGQRIGFLTHPTYSYVALQWAIWRSGGVAVPLSSHHTPEEHKYFLQVRDCRASHGPGCNVQCAAD